MKVTREKVQQWVDQELGDNPSPKDYFRLSKQLNEMCKSAVKSKENYTPAEYMTFELGATAYQYILDNGGTPEEAFSYASEVCDKSMEYINKTKNKPYIHSSNIVESYKEHPKQKRMVRKGTIDTVSLKNSDTVGCLISFSHRSITTL